MKLILFFASVLIIIIPSIKIFLNKNGNTFGINLNKRWLIGLAFFELLWLCYCWWDYSSSIDPTVADDFFWHNQFNYFRGVIVVGWLTPSHLNMRPSFWTLLATYLGALTFDYCILFILTIIKRRHW